VTQARAPSPTHGPRIVAEGEVEFSLWAPDAQSVALAFENGPEIQMRKGAGGMFSLRAKAAPGDAYRFLINGETKVPDPAAHAQAADVHGPSLVIDHAFAWKNPSWTGRPWHESVIYELHPGALGGFSGIAAELPRLKSLGFTAIELMPIADFPGAHNWGYDGVLPFAPDARYGTPHDLKTLIDTAHGLGLQIFLDVVYNHFGPDGNYLNAYAKSFFREDQHTPWGNAIDFRKREVRDFFIGNALFWLNTYRFDGLRFDAVHAIDDHDFLLEMAAAIRAETPGRHIHLILENEHNDATLLNNAAETQKYDAQWADDWHHCAHVLLTRESEGYYEDFQNPAEQLARCLAEGFAYQGDPSPHHGNHPRGTDSKDHPATAFIICLQNHDQIGNRAMGERLRSLAHPDALRAAIALLLFTPQIPMMFMGEEFGETRPFLYFTDHHDELGKLVTQGRRKEFAHFAAFTHPETREKIPDPNARATFEASRPQVTQNAWSELVKTCLALRHKHITPRMPNAATLGASALSAHAVRAAWRMGDGAILTLATNFDSNPAPCEKVDGNLLYGPALQSGMLAPLTTCFWLKP
jgi:maltooligosyltrehalose trehalohydrolase